MSEIPQKLQGDGKFPTNWNKLVDLVVSLMRFSATPPLAISRVSGGFALRLTHSVTLYLGTIVASISPGAAGTMTLLDGTLTATETVIDVTNPYANTTAAAGTRWFAISYYQKVFLVVGECVA